MLLFTNYMSCWLYQQFELTIDFVDNKKNVLIKLPSAFQVVADANYKLEISQNVKTTSGAVMAAHGTNGGTFTQLVGLNDNVAPELSKVEVVKDTNKYNKVQYITH